MMKRSCLSVASLARWTDFSYLVAAMPARIMIMTMTIMISSRVNPAAQIPRCADEMWRRVFLHPRTGMGKGLIRALPLGVFRPVDRCRLGLRIYVEHVVPAPTCGIGVVLHSAQTPVGFPGHRIHWNFSEISYLGGCVQPSLASGAARS